MKKPSQRRKAVRDDGRDGRICGWLRGGFCAGCRRRHLYRSTGEEPKKRAEVMTDEPDKAGKPKNALIAFAAVMLIAVIAFYVFIHYRVIQPSLHEATLYIEGATAQDLRRDKESRKKQNPITISQFMGKPYAQVSIQEVLERMIHEGTTINLYWENDVWKCLWERQGKRYLGQGLDPEDAIADVLGKSLPSDTPAK